MLTVYPTGFVYLGLRKTLSPEMVAEIGSHADSLGFSKMVTIGTSPMENDHRVFYDEFLVRGLHADLKYLERPQRFELSAILPTARTLLIFLYPYRFPAIEKKFRKAPFKIARYAWQRDYHDVLKTKLTEILTKFHLTGRAVTDSAPMAERYWARRAGAGFIGKNGMLIDAERGSYFMIASLLIEEELADLPPKETSVSLARDFHEYCQDCNLCTDSCPTGALFGDGLMDIKKCISYQTIEAKNNISVTADSKQHRWIFGCDICQQVCPYNKSEKSFAVDKFSDEHPAAERIAIGEVMDTRAELRNSVFFRRGTDALQRNRMRLNLPAD